MITRQAFPGGREQYTGVPDRGSEKDYAFPGGTVSDEDDDIEEELVSDDEDPILTEEDLEENDLTDEEADDIEWDDEEPQR